MRKEQEEFHRMRVEFHHHNSPLGQQRFVLAGTIYRAGGRSWNPPAQNHQGPLS